MRGKKVLLIDNDLDTHEIVAQTFTNVGAQVISASNGKEGLSLLYTHHPDMVILAILLPDMEGWEVCRTIRLFSDVPVIILTAVHGETLEVRSLDEGATDFMTKPFNTRILLARAKAAMRKVRQAASLPPLAIFKDRYLHINIPQGIIQVKGQSVKLSPIEQRLLAYILSHMGRVVTRQQIMKFIWPSQPRTDMAKVHVYISRLRSKLQDNPKRPNYIHTIPGLGYMFNPQIDRPNPA